MTMLVIITSLSAVVGVCSAIFNIMLSLKSYTSDQASKVAVWAKDDYLLLSNKSALPVYSVIITSCVLKSVKDPSNMEEAFQIVNSGYQDLSVKGKATIDSGNRVSVGILPPGNYCVAVPKLEKRKNSDRYYEIAFRDSGNRVWIRCSNGKLKRCHCRSIDSIYERISVPMFSEIHEVNP